MDDRPEGFGDLQIARAWYRRWFLEQALPFWSDVGFDPRTARFHEAVRADGPALAAPRRARVQARQIWVYATAAQRGLGRPQLALLRRAYEAFIRDYRQENGLFAMSLSADGVVLDRAQPLYEQAFALLAMAAMRRADPERLGPLQDAEALREGIEKFRHVRGGFREIGFHPYQANAQMHLLEAVLAWEEIGGAAWMSIADEIAGLAIARLIDPQKGFIREFFDRDWRPAVGDDGRWVEPGHQFEWCWLLSQWADRRGDRAGGDAARRLYENGLKGVDKSRRVAVNVLWDDLSPREPSARLWPQTEYLKASLLMERQDEVLTAAQGLSAYLVGALPGAWLDMMLPDGSLVQGQSPASSFYHIAGACFPLLIR